MAYEVDVPEFYRELSVSSKEELKEMGFDRETVDQIYYHLDGPKDIEEYLAVHTDMLNNALRIYNESML